jgi:hypothetical protein
MNDRDQRPEVDRPPEQSSKHLKYLDAVLPNIEWQNDLQTVYNLSSSQAELYKARAEQFSHCSKVILPIGMWGMGDSVMALRFAICFAIQSGKEVICQSHPQLLGFGQRLHEVVPNIRLVAKVPLSDVEDAASFVMRFTGGGGRIDTPSQWVEGDEMRANQIIQEKMAALHTLELEDLTAKKIDSDEPFPEPFAPVENRMDTFNTTYYLAGFTAQSIGVNLNAEDLKKVSIFHPTQEEVEQISQDLDFIFIPDAKEFPAMDDSQSMKSLTKETWQRICNLLPAGQKIGIVRGVSHPEYCDQIVRIAEGSGHQVEVIDGGLTQLGYKLLRARKIVGMDSGTTHLSKDVVTAAAWVGRKIELKPLFNELYSHFEQYGIVDTRSFVYGEESAEVAEEMSQFIQN